MNSWQLPQKKCRMNITRTRLATFGPLYRSLKGIALPSSSKTDKFSTLFKTSCEGISSVVFNSPSNSSGASTLFNSDGVEVSMDALGGVDFESGTFVSFPSIFEVSFDAATPADSEEIAMHKSVEDPAPSSAQCWKLRQVVSGCYGDDKNTAKDKEKALWLLSSACDEIS